MKQTILYNATSLGRFVVHIKRLQVRSSKPRGTSHARIQRGVGVGHGVQTHTLKITKYRFLSNTDPDPLKNKKKLPSQPSMLGHHLPASETPFQWRFAGGLMMTGSIMVFGSSLSKLSDKSFWIRACFSPTRCLLSK